EDPPRHLHLQVEMARRILLEGLSAEQVREEVLRRKPARGGRAAVLPEAAPPSAGEAGSRPISVAGALEGYAADARELDRWLEGRDWAPSRVTGKQRQALDELAEAVSLVQQHLISIRRRLREP